MAERLKIEGNFLIVFEDGSPSTEYINAQRARVVPSYDPSDIVRFYENGIVLGKNGVSEYDCTTIIDDRTGSAFTSVAELKTFLSKNLGGFFLSSGNNGRGGLPVSDIDVSGRNSLNTGFGDKITASRIPEISSQFMYGIEDGDAVLITNNGGSFDYDEARVKISTGTDINGYAELKSADFIRYIPGYEGWFSYTWAYNAPVANNRQKGGVWDGNNGFYIGYEGTDFVLGISREGVDTETIIDPSTILLTYIDGSTQPFNPQNGNIYRITYEYLGYGPVDYEIQNPDKTWRLLGRIEYPNSSKQTHITNPYLPLRAIIQNFGNNTDVVGFGGSVAAGSMAPSDAPDVTSRKRSFDAGTNAISGGTTEIITFRNRANFYGIENRIKMRLMLISIATDLAKNGTVELLKNATFTNVPTWTDIDTLNSIVEYSTDALIDTSTGLDMVDFSMAKVDSVFEQVENLELELRPAEYFTVIITTQNPGGDINYSQRWRELF